ncbi:MAG TPA: amidohydrolase family protein [Bryobacteraceae bacterium]|jgi:imidazolonepropionase-like amidohydrolase|nr:amidohydrolase family protein [Bryobacteraceae bacterium]
MRLFVLTAFTLFLVTCDVHASSLALNHAIIYTQPDRLPIYDGIILIQDTRIAAVGPTRTIKLPPGIRSIDCRGLAVTAGFWNSHVHFLPAPLLHADHQSPDVLNSQLQAMFTRWGFTTVFDIASILANTNYIRSQINAGKLPGPRVLTVGEPFWIKTPIYVQQYLAKFNIAMPAVHSIPEARVRVDRQIRDGADGIKIFAGSSEAGHVEYMPADLASAIVAEAHRYNKLVFSHPSTIKGIEISLDASVGILAHVTTSEANEPGTTWPPELVARMKAVHMSLIPTLTLFDVEMQKGHASPEAIQHVIALAVSQLHAYASAGGQIFFGTDIGYIDHYDTTEEFQLMSRAGMTFPKILASLTTNPAQPFGYASHSGRIAPGFDADLAILDSDSAADITALSRVAYTIRNGKVIFNSNRPAAANRPKRSQ